MHPELVIPSWSMLAALDGPTISLRPATALKTSTAAGFGESAGSPTASNPSWANQLSAYSAAASAAAACLTLGIALLRPLRAGHVEQARSRLEKTSLRPALRTGLQQLRATAPPRPALISAARTAAASSPAGNTGGEAR